MRYFVSIGGEEHVAAVRELPDGTYVVDVGREGDASSASRRVELSDGAMGRVARVDGRVIELVVDGSGVELSVNASGSHELVRLESERSRIAASVRAASGRTGTGQVRSPMPGKVVKVLVEPGQTVEQGAGLVVVEAMKMENELVAGASGCITKVLVAPGDAVEGGALLVEIE
jgi:glutaconyl-CoA/methylmalonyl-CoA decarboxylase subunit gamma